MKKPETVADVVRIIAEINAAIDEYYKVILNYTPSKPPISEKSLKTLKYAAELYVEKLREIKVN